MKNIYNVHVDDGIPTNQPYYTCTSADEYEPASAEECEPIIRISFSYTNECGEHFSASSDMTVYESLGDRPIDLIAEQFNHFLRQVGYYRPNNYILIEDLTDAEYDYLTEKLNEYRGTIINKEDD